MGPIDLFLIALILLAIFGVQALLRRWPVKDRKRHALPPPPEFEQRVQDLEVLKSGRLWGDVGQAEPWQGDWR